MLESQAVTILWTRPDHDGGADITSYDLQYWQGELPDADTNWNLRSNIWRVTRDSKTSFRLGGLRNGNRYWARLRAVNGGGEGSWSSARPGVPRTAPGSPPKPGVQPGQWELEISWAEPRDDGGAQVIRLRPASQAVKRTERAPVLDGRSQHLDHRVQGSGIHTRRP